MFELHESLHDDYGICLWTILTIALLVAIAVVLIVHLYRQKRREDKAERDREEIAKTGAAQAAQIDGR